MDFETGPGFRHARIDVEFVSFQFQTQKGLRHEPIHPAGGAGVPAPTASADVWSDAINIGGNNVGFDFVGGDLLWSGAMMDRIEKREKFPGEFVLAELCE